ncbi:MAG: hypothetical protein KBT29_05190 [Prevotellaceae bacterium]|nr:hypothetical protein [Candidatus Minthosoma caballi]
MNKYELRQLVPADRKIHDNIASNTSLQRLGFSLVKTFSRHGYLRNLYVMKVAE